MVHFQGKVVWVTGSSSGIGRAIALMFAEHGADVIVHGFANVDKAREVATIIESMGRKSLVVSGNVGKSDEVQRMVQEIEVSFGRLDVLVNNAGTIVNRHRLMELEESLWDEILDVNLKSVYLVSKMSLSLIRKSGQGRIINITSTAARNGGGRVPISIAYVAAKGGVSALTRALAKDLVEYGITVNAIAPGFIDTPLHDRLTSREGRQRSVSEIPMGREGKPTDVAGGCLYLASHHADYITGEIININGGSLMG